ncbi:MAG: class I SAM-dependent methyltransferase [Bacteroidota bacterium]
MSRIPVYATDWLNERFPFDAAARNGLVEQACLRALDDQKVLHLVDIGAGNGANPRYFLDRLSQNQSWTMVELDPLLGKAAIQELAAHGPRLGYKSSFLSDAELVLSKAEKTVHIRSICGSLLELDSHVDLNQTDLVLANAVFDLFSEEQFVHFCQKLLRHHTSFLSTLNYIGMSLSPNEADDKKIIALYESHMQRLQAFGRAMGTDGPAFIENWLATKTGKVVVGESIWGIGTEAEEMHRYLLGFMEEAIPELPLPAEQLADFRHWLDRKRQLSANQNLHISVNHKDIFFLPTTQ